MKPRRERNTWSPLEIQLRKQHEQEVAQRRRDRFEAAAARMREKYRLSDRPAAELQEGLRKL